MEFTYKSDIACMCYFSSKMKLFVSKVPRDSESQHIWPPATLYRQVQDAFHMSCFGGTFARVKPCLGLPTFTERTDNTWITFVRRTEVISQWNDQQPCIIVHLFVSLLYKMYMCLPFGGSARCLCLPNFSANADIFTKFPWKLISTPCLFPKLNVYIWFSG